MQAPEEGGESDNEEEERVPTEKEVPIQKEVPMQREVPIQEEVPVQKETSIQKEKRRVVYPKTSASDTSLSLSEASPRMSPEPKKSKRTKTRKSTAPVAIMEPVEGSVVSENTENPDTEEMRSGNASPTPSVAIISTKGRPRMSAAGKFQIDQLEKQVSDELDLVIARGLGKKFRPIIAEFFETAGEERYFQAVTIQFRIGSIDPRVWNVTIPFKRDLTLNEFHSYLLLWGNADRFKIEQ